MTFASNKLAHNWDCNLYEAQWCLNGTRKHIYQIWRLTKKPISSTPSLGPLSRGENTLPSLPEWSWTPNLPGKRQNCAHGDCQSCTLPKWLFASKILTLVTRPYGPWWGPKGPTVQLGQTTSSYHWPSRPAMHDLETYANVDAHSADPPLVRCFHHRVCLQILSSQEPHAGENPAWWTLAAP